MAFYACFSISLRPFCTHSDLGGSTTLTTRSRDGKAFISCYQFMFQANMMLNNTTSQTTVESTPTPPGTFSKVIEQPRDQRTQSPVPPREISTHNRVTTPRHRASPLTSSVAEKKHAVATDYSQSAKTPTMFRTPQEMASHFLTANGGGLGGLFRPGFPSAAYTPSAHPTLLQSSLQSSSILSSQLQNGKGYFHYHLPYNPL